MVKSMTGFGRSEIVENDRKFAVEIKSVNHRFCDMSIKLPKKISFLETNIRTYLKKYVERGKVDVFITYEDYSSDNANIRYNDDVARVYMNYFKRMSEEFEIPMDIKLTDLGNYPEVFTVEEESVDPDELWKQLVVPLDEACRRFVESRENEGENLKKDLIDKLDAMKKSVERIEEISPKLVSDYREKLTEKVKELLGTASVDESRIATEVVIYADKICVDEEIVRLISHIDSTKDILLAGGSVGRKLDFIAQEMNRESNTILSKVNSLEISDIAISLKTNIEKVREQIQNLE